MGKQEKELQKKGAQYEAQRATRIAHNKERMESLGLQKMANSLMGSKGKEKQKEKVVLEKDKDIDYEPESDDEDDEVDQEIQKEKELESTMDRRNDETIDRNVGNQENIPSQSKKRKGRGPSRAVQSSVPMILDFDEFDLPIGRWESLYGRQIGQCALRIDITAQEFSKVDPVKLDIFWAETKMEHLEKEAKEIEDGVVVSSEPGKDALSKALGKPDNYGYVKGISRLGVGVGHRKVFGQLPRKGIIISNRDQEIEELKETIKRMESRFETTLQQKVAEEVKSYIASLSSLNIPPILEIKCAPTQQQPILHSMIIKEPKICRLAMEDDDGNLFVVADGTVHPCDDGVVHSSKLLPDHYKVSIDNPYEEHKLVKLPVPSPDGETELGKSKGYFVQWPISMVVFDEMDNALKTLSQSKEQVGSCDPYRSQESGAGLDNQLALFDVGDLDMDTSEIALLKMIMLEENPDTIVVPIKAPLLYYQKNEDIWVTSNDISEMMNGAWLNVSIFHVYILYLIEDLRDKGQGERITFLCPQIISGDECKRDFFGAIRYLKHAFTYELQKKESSHCKFILAPYKEECHWILLVVDLRAGVVFEFDSLAQQLTRPTLLLCENALKYAYKSYRARLKGQSNNTTLLFKQIKCAQQPGGRECGYYVMRFMYEIVNQYSQCMGDLAQEYIARSSAYSQDEIDEVREQWAKYFRLNFLLK